ncbi:protein TBATA-like [Liolophura sinensis]|uniref:protein TBATA-like n=1 Tax=Liolophura sinensis TaxID=3198878 RepID=UPI0031595ED2
MSQSEVFRPSNGPLVVRSTMADGNQGVSEMSRPATQSGYRFGQLSRNSFFTRHNPHPNRVRHIKGLLDIPICSVNDQGFFANPRYSLQFPPDSYNQKKLSKSWDHRLPVNAINVNSQLHPINTITGLAYFTGLRNYPWREKAIPKVGLVPVTEAWRDELRSLAQAAGFLQEKQEAPNPDIERRPQTMYSSETGRLIPPPSRAMTRGGSRWGNRFPAALQHIAAEPDPENMVLTMLCQILQTDDINAVQAWLCSAGDREKGVVLDLIRSATMGREEYYKQYPAQFVQPPLELGEKHATLPPIGEKNRTADAGMTQDSSNYKFDRLSLDDMPMKDTQPTLQQRPVVGNDQDISTLRPPSADMFQKREPSKVQMKTPPKSPLKQRPERSEVCLRYTKSPSRLDSVENQDHSDLKLDATSPSVNTF